MPRRKSLNELDKEAGEEPERTNRAQGSGAKAAGYQDILYPMAALGNQRIADGRPRGRCPRRRNGPAALYSA